MVADLDKIQKLKQGQRVAFIAAGVTFLLAAMKAIVGYLFDARMLVADAFHSGADLLAIFASGFGLWLAAKKKTKRFPYGLYKEKIEREFLSESLTDYFDILDDHELRGY